MTDDTQLLQEYARDGSEAAFRELVGRHIPLVLTTARRLAARDVHFAQDITQVVFSDLAHKASSLPAGIVLGGWLYRHTCFIAAKAVRTEHRRRRRETTFMEMSALHEPDPTQDIRWQQLAPVLDDALRSLSAPDRDAIVLRYLQQQDLRSIGRTLGTSESAVQMRISRALEKLRALLVRRGVTLSSALLATTLDAAATPLVPPGLADMVSAKAVTTAAVKTAFTLSYLKTMITSKLGLTLASVVAVTGVTLVIFAQNNPAPNAPAVASTPVNDNPAQTAPATVQTVAPAAIATSAPSGIKSSVAVARTPSGTTTEFHASMVKNANGVVTSTNNDNGVVQTQTQSLPATGALAGGNGGAGFVASSGPMPANAFSMPTGKPASTTVNADGSTTIVYADPNGSTVEVTVSADGKSRSMSSMAVAAPSSN